MRPSLEHRVILDGIVAEQNLVSALAIKIIQIFPDKASDKFFMLDALRYLLDSDLKTVLPICGWEQFGGELSDAKIDCLIPWPQRK
jgi:hypothetical protein